MSIEGGSFKCYIHDFETPIVSEWNEHCTKKKHTEEGVTACKDCGKQIKFSNLPFKAFDELGHKNISLQCPDCSDKMSNVKMEIVS